MSKLRFPLCLGLSAAAHLLLGLLLWFDVRGVGGGFGIGSGPGIGIGQGGGFGLGQNRRRQVFALKDVHAQPAPPRRGRLEERLAAVVPPAGGGRAAIPLAGDLPVALPRAVALPPPPAAIRSDVAAHGAAGAVVFGGLGGGGGGGGFGTSLGAGLTVGGAFGRYVEDLRARGLDVVFVIDGTASMQHVIDRVRRDLDRLVGTIESVVPVARVGFVVYRDRGDRVPIEVAPLTSSRRKLTAFLAGLRAEGGGDWPESLNLGLEAAWQRMAWRPDAKRILVFLASSPPHDDEREATLAVARQVREAGGAVSALDLSRGMHEDYAREIARANFGRDATREELERMPAFYAEVRKTFAGVTAAGGGEVLDLEADDRMVEHLLVLAFGTRWKSELQRLARETGGTQATKPAKGSE